MRTAVVALGCCLLPLLLAGPARCNEDSDTLDRFIASWFSAIWSGEPGLDRHDAGYTIYEFIRGYHRKPAPAQVPSMLRTALKIASEEPWSFNPPGPKFFAHAFGYMARGRTKLVRQYEWLFEKSLQGQPGGPAQPMIGEQLTIKPRRVTTLPDQPGGPARPIPVEYIKTMPRNLPPGSPAQPAPAATLVVMPTLAARPSTREARSFLLEALRICGDTGTRKRLEQWAADPRCAESKKEIEATRAFLANPRRLYPRDRAAQSEEDIYLLRADFLVTRDHAPMARVLDALEQPRSLRVAIEKRLKSPLPDKTKGPDVLANLKSFNLLVPNSKNRLVKGDLELTLLYDRKGQLRGDGLVLLGMEQDELFNLKDKALARAIAMHGAAAHFLQDHLEEDSRFAEWLKKHYRDYGRRAQELVKRWLGIDQTFHLSKEAKELQGSWQAFAEESEESKKDGPMLTAKMLKYVRWTFEEDEISATKVLTLNHTKILGQGGTNVSTYEIDASKEPRRIVLTASSGDDFTTKYPCIYKLEGDVLTICMSKGKHFPKSFTADAGVVIWKLKRVKVTPAVLRDLARMGLVESVRAQSGDPGLVIGLTLALAAILD